MTNIKSLRQRAHDIVAQMGGILAHADAGKRDLNAEEDREYLNLKTKLSGVEAEICQAEDALEEQRRTPAEGEPLSTTNAQPYAPSRSRLGATHGRRYSEMFPQDLSSGGFQSLEEFLRTVHGGLADPRLQATATGMGGNVPTDGGFLVPGQFSAEILDVSLENEIVRPLATVYPMTSDTRKIAGLDSLDNSGGAPYGGFSIQWANEGDTGTLKKAKTRLIQLSAQKGMVFSFASNELIADGMSFDELIGNALVRSLGWGLDYAFLQGDGAGKPKGVLNDPALIVVSKESGQAANTILYENVSNMFARLHPSCMSNAVWLANSTALPQLLRMQLVVKNVAGTENVGGSATPVFAQSNGKFTLLTRPVIFTEKLPTLSSQGDIVLCDFSQYAIGLRKELSVERSSHVGWATDESGYRAIVRADGQGRWNQAFKPKNGNSLSWCVTLQAR